MDDDGGFELIRALVNVAVGGKLDDLAGVWRALGIETSTQRMAAPVPVRRTSPTPPGPDQRRGPTAVDALAIDEAQWMEERIAALEQAVRKLREQGVEVRASDVRAVVEALVQAHRKTADPRKRRLLEQAAGHAFDRGLYEEGLTIRLLGIMEELTYGNVAFLRRFSEQFQPLAVKDTVRRPGTIEQHQAGLLVRLGLLHSNYEVGGGSWLTGLEGQLSITALGRKLLALLADAPVEAQ